MICLDEEIKKEIEIKKFKKCISKTKIV